jgi:hypothetical protein
MQKHGEPARSLDQHPDRRARSEQSARRKARRCRACAPRAIQRTAPSERAVADVAPDSARGAGTRLCSTQEAPATPKREPNLDVGCGTTNEGPTPPTPPRPKPESCADPSPGAHTSPKGRPSLSRRLWSDRPHGGPSGCRADTIVGRGEIAQLVEHTTENRSVLGSIPSLATKKALQMIMFVVRTGAQVM